MILKSIYRILINGSLVVLSMAILSSNINSQKEDPNKNWQSLMNGSSDYSLSVYHSKSVFIDANGNVFDSQEEKEIYIKKLKAELGSIRSITSIRKTTVIPNKLEYEIGAFETTNSTYRHIVIWSFENNKKVRELEFITKKEASKKTLIDEINKARNKWITLCNKHNASNLVSTLYTPSAIYYNHKPVVIGTSAISKEYSYMNNPKYSLSLKPIHTEIVTNNMALEIGQCSGSYNGKYLLVWKKNKDDQWQIMVDSNL